MHAVRFQVVSIWQCKPSSVTVTLCNRCDIVTVRKRRCGKVMFYTCLPVILFTGGVCLPQCMLGTHLPWADTPGQTPLQADSPHADTPLPSACWDTHPLPSAFWDTPPASACWDRHGYCCGQYASYWNAFLLFLTSR